MIIILVIIISMLIGAYVEYKWIMSKNIEMIDKYIEGEIWENENNNNNNSNNNSDNVKE